MHIFSWNVNGLRAVHRKGALETFIKTCDPDILLLQEIKGNPEQFDKTLVDATYTRLFNPAQKPGYSGVALWAHPRTGVTQEQFEKSMQGYQDNEGRVVQVHLEEITVIGVYVPNGGKSDEAYVQKLAFLKHLKKHVQKLQKEKRGVVIGGDFNVARSDIDVAQPEKFQKHINFCPEVREHMESLLGAGMVDSFRKRNPEKEGAYTYWDNFDFSLPKGTKPREVNRGWRLDYLLADTATDEMVVETQIHNDIMGSDHCPISLTIR